MGDGTKTKEGVTSRAHPLEAARKTVGHFYEKQRASWRTSTLRAGPGESFNAHGTSWNSAITRPLLPAGAETCTEQEPGCNVASRAPAGEAGELRINAPKENHGPGAKPSIVVASER